ncbi:ATP synthase F1 subunit delta [Thermodesulfobacteriota bacterium]
MKKDIRFFKKPVFILFTLLSIIAVTYSLSLAGGAPAAAGGSVDLKSFGLKVFNFLFLFFMLAYFVKKPLKNFLISRKKNIEDSIKGADDSLEAVKKEYKRSEAKLKSLAEEIKEITQKMQHEGELEKDRIIKRSEEAAKKIHDQTETTIQREFEVIKKKIKEETIESTINIAEDILKDKFKATDQDKVAGMIASEISEVKDIEAFLQTPISNALKKKVPVEIDSKTKVTEMTMSFIKVLVAADDDKKKSVEDIKKAYESYLSDVTGTKKAQILSATDIDEAALSKITGSLKKAVGKDIEIEVVKDPSIIGGIVTKIGSLVFDASVKTQLESMRENLKNEVV